MFKELLKKIAVVLDAQGIGYMIIGGQARGMKRMFGM